MKGFYMRIVSFPLNYVIIATKMSSQYGKIKEKVSEMLLFFR